MKWTKKKPSVGKRRAAIVASVGEIHRKHTGVFLVVGIVLLVIGLGGLGYLAYKQFRKAPPAHPSYSMPQPYARPQRPAAVSSDQAAATKNEITQQNQQLYDDAVAKLQDPSQQTAANYLIAANYAINLGKKDDAKNYIAKAKPLVAKLSDKAQQNMLNGLITSMESQVK